MSNSTAGTSPLQPERSTRHWPLLPRKTHMTVPKMRVAVTDFSVLDNPIWGALTTVHASMALSKGLARRYPGDISPLAALHDPTAEAFADLAALVGPEDGVGLFTPEPLELPGEWQVIRTLTLDQMVCTEPVEPPAFQLLPLGEADVAEILALTAATEPGPFRSRTIKMGRYFGIRSGDGHLAAMAGERLQLDGFTEISAVCTDPGFRGRGYARALVASLAASIRGAGKTPFLHVTPTNGARVLYEKVGFRLRRAVQLTVLARHAHNGVGRPV